MLALFLLACVTPDPATDSATKPTDTGTGNDTADTTAPIETTEPTVTQLGDSNVYAVTWSSKAPGLGSVRYDADGVEQQIEEDVFGTEHEVLLVGLGGGRTYTLVAVTAAEGASSESAPFTIETAVPPSDIPEPIISEDVDHTGGFELLPILAGGHETLAIVNHAGAFVWWEEGREFAAWSAEYTAGDQRVHWLERDGKTGHATIATSTLDHDESRVLTNVEVHHDFALLPSGNMVVIAFDDRTYEGQVIRSDRLVELAPDGTELRTLWSAWDNLPYDGNAMTEVDGTLQWPHANSVSFDDQTATLLVSLWCTDTVVAVDLASGAQKWQIGGVDSDFEFVGAAFSGQHSPVLMDNGKTLLLMDNGDLGSALGLATAAVYTLDTSAGTATRIWQFDDDEGHLGALLGSTQRTDSGDYAVNWGSAGRLQTVSATGDVQWQLDFKLGSGVGFSQHLEDLGGAAR